MACDGKRKHCMKPLHRPPESVVFKRRKRESEPVGELTLSLDEFRALIAEAKSKRFDHEFARADRPIQSSLLEPRRGETCAVCNSSLLRSSCARRAKTLCSHCGTRFARSVFLAPARPSVNVERFYNLYLNVVKGEHRLLVCPVNFFVGSLAPGMLSDVEAAFDYLERPSSKALLNKRFGKIVPVARALAGSETQESRRIKRAKHLETTPQRALCYSQTLCARVVDRPKRGKENEIRRTCLSRVIGDVSRLVIGTSGSLPADRIVLPSAVMRGLGCSDTYLAIRYPVIQSGNIAFAKATADTRSLDRSTCDIPSALFKYNGGDNDGDAFNFIRLHNGLLSNAAFEAELLMSPRHNIGSGGHLKVHFDSDTCIGLGAEWSSALDQLLLEYVVTGSSTRSFEKFCALERRGRCAARSKGFFTLDEYFVGLNEECGLGRMITSCAVGRYNMNHYEQATHRLGLMEFVYNKDPVKRHVDSCFTTGLTASEFIASCQASFDALADRESDRISTQGNMQYQCFYVLRPSVLAYDRFTVFNPVTRRTVSTDVSSFFVLRRPNLSASGQQKIIHYALAFARAVCGLQPCESACVSDDVLQRILAEAAQYRTICCRP